MIPSGELGDSPEKRMKLRYAGTCRLCGIELPANTIAIYERASKTVRCVHCPIDQESPKEPHAAHFSLDDSVMPGKAGSSARREYERRKANDEERLHKKWGRFSGIASALSEERQSTTAWARGAIGEERLGAKLDSLVSANVAVLHDRRIPKSTANIDHIVVTQAGVWVIDAKRYKGRPEVRIEGGILRPRVEKLTVGRRDCTRLVDGMLKQVAVVRDVVETVPITGVLCFVDADWPIFARAFTTRGVHVLWPKHLAEVLQDSQVGEVDVKAIGNSLASRLKPA